MTPTTLRTLADLLEQGSPADYPEMGCPCECHYSGGDDDCCNEAGR